jgi:hypothetical protein
VRGSPAILLPELGQDALTKLLNIGVNRAATGLHAMIGQEVLMSAPGVTIITRENAAQIIAERETGSLLLNACPATIANLLTRPSQRMWCRLFTSTSAWGRQVSRYVAMVIDFPSLAPRKQLTTEFVRPAAG